MTIEVAIFTSPQFFMSTILFISSLFFAFLIYKKLPKISIKPLLIGLFVFVGFSAIFKALSVGLFDNNVSKIGGLALRRLLLISLLGSTAHLFLIGVMIQWQNIKIRRISILVSIGLAVFFSILILLGLLSYARVVYISIPVIIFLFLVLINKYYITREKPYLLIVLGLMFAILGSLQEVAPFFLPLNFDSNTVYIVSICIAISFFYLGLVKGKLLSITNPKKDVSMDKKLLYGPGSIFLILMVVVCGFYVNDAIIFYTTYYYRLPSTQPSSRSVNIPKASFNDVLNSSLTPMGSDALLLTTLINGSGSYEVCSRMYKDYYSDKDVIYEYKAKQCIDNDTLTQTGTVTLNHIRQAVKNNSGLRDFGVAVMEDINASNQEVYLIFYHVMATALRNNNQDVYYNTRILSMIPLSEELFVEKISTADNNEIYVIFSNGKKKTYSIQNNNNLIEIIDHDTAILDNPFLDFLFLYPRDIIANLEGFNPYVNDFGYKFTDRYTYRVRKVEQDSGKRPVYYNERCNLEPTLADAQIRLTPIGRIPKFSDSSRNRVTLYVHKIESPIVYLTPYTLDVYSPDEGEIVGEIDMQEYVKSIQSGDSPTAEKKVNLEIIDGKKVRHILPFDSCNFIASHQYQWVQDKLLFNLVVETDTSVRDIYSRFFPVELIDTIIRSLKVR